MTATPATTIREIVATDYRTAAVFERHGLDYCCNGCRTIEQGCRDAGADEGALLARSTRSSRTPAADVAAFRVLGPPGAHHRTSSRTTTPTCARRCRRCSSTPRKIADGPRRTAHRAGARRAALRARRRGDDDHMAKEEHMLFPYIAALDAAASRRPARADGAVRHRRQSDPDDGERAPVRRRRHGRDAAAHGRLPAA